MLKFRINPNFCLNSLFACSTASSSFSASASKYLRLIDSSSRQSENSDSTVNHSESKLNTRFTEVKLDLVLLEQSIILQNWNSSCDRKHDIVIFQNFKLLKF